MQLSGVQQYAYDAYGTLLSDGQLNYTWDAESRLVGITYPGLPGKATAFTYDGLSRRTSITSTPSGGGPTTTSYLWCGSQICQARNSSNAVTREYYAEGEFLPGTPAQPYYYGVDQIGSVRRVFASTSSAPAFGYDAYGNALQATAPVTDLNFVSMFYSADGGLTLTQYRAYDPVTGRWLSRDPLGEGSDPAANLYRYADGDPVALIDPDGSQALAGVIRGAIGGAVVGGGLDLAAQLAQNGGHLGCVSWSEVGASAALGAATSGLSSLAVRALRTFAKLRAQAARDFAALRAEAARLKALKGGPDESGAGGAPKPTPNFIEPTNPPQQPPTELPPGHSVRVMPPTEQYPDGYWVQYNEGGQRVDPSTGKPPSNVTRPVARSQTHVPLPPQENQ